MKILLGCLAIVAIYFGGLLVGGGADGWWYVLACVLEGLGGWAIGGLMVGAYD